jgi:hypothetical protein
MQPNKSPVRTELDRVGASFRRAGAADCITVIEDDDAVRLVGPPREHPRRYWKGPRWQLLELLAALPDDAGVQAVWRTLASSRAARSPLYAERTRRKGVHWMLRLRLDRWIATCQATYTGGVLESLCWHRHLSVEGSPVVG